jgi:hypothetical protein
MTPSLRHPLRTAAVLTAGLAMAVSSLSAVPSSATGTAAPETSTVDEQTIVMVPNRYIVTLNGHQTRDGSFAADASAAAVRRLVRKAGGSTVASYRQIGGGDRTF